MFTLDDLQIERINKWMSQCIAETKDKCAIGGRFTYEFTPTGLGTITKVIDFYTKQEIDVTPYEHW